MLFFLISSSFLAEPNYWRSCWFVPPEQFLALMDVLFFWFGVKCKTDTRNLQQGGPFSSQARITSLLIWKYGSQITSWWDWKQYWFGNSGFLPVLKFNFALLTDPSRPLDCPFSLKHSGLFWLEQIWRESQSVQIQNSLDRIIFKWLLY